MTALETVQRFIVPEAVIKETDAQLRAAGRSGLERFVLWSGVQQSEIFHIRSAHVPRQSGYRLQEGMCVRVDGNELHRLNIWLFEHHEQLAVQVHSHPTDAYHSETDDTYPIVTVRGGLSVVVPNFGRDGVGGRGVACYRLGIRGWNKLPVSQVRDLIHIEELMNGSC